MDVGLQVVQTCISSAFRNSVPDQWRSRLVCILTRSAVAALPCLLVTCCMNGLHGTLVLVLVYHWHACFGT